MVFIDGLRIEGGLMVITDTVQVFFVLQIEVIINFFILGEVDCLVFIDVVLDIVFDRGNLGSDDHS